MSVLERSQQSKELGRGAGGQVRVSSKFWQRLELNGTSPGNAGSQWLTCPCRVLSTDRVLILLQSEMQEQAIA